MLMAGYSIDAALPLQKRMVSEALATPGVTAAGTVDGAFQRKRQLRRFLTATGPRSSAAPMLRLPQSTSPSRPGICRPPRRA